MANNSLIIEGFNIAELDDEALKQRLENLGFIPGPIVASTRCVYQRKLAQLLRGGGAGDAGSGDGDSGSGSDVVDEEVRPSPIYDLRNFTDYASPSTSYCGDELRRRPLPRLSGESFAESPSRMSSFGRPFSADDIVSQVAPPLDENGRSPLSTTAKLICVSVLVILALLIYFNMESTPDNPFVAPPEQP